MLLEISRDELTTLWVYLVGVLEPQKLRKIAKANGMSVNSIAPNVQLLDMAIEKIEEAATGKNEEPFYIR